jgi:transcriptional regulator with XRE-family HTH domain
VVSFFDTLGTFMGSSVDLVSALKAELKRSGLTYAQLGVALNLAESSVKRIFAKNDMPLSRIDQILAVLKMDFAELARIVALASPARQELTAEQERAVVADPKLLLAAICVLSQWSLEEVVATYAISKHRALACFMALDKLGFIQLRGSKTQPYGYRLKIDKTFRWRPNGPVMQYFRKHAVGDYFDGGFEGPGEMLMLVHGQVKTLHAEQFNERLQRLVQDFAQQHVADQKLPAHERVAYTVVIGMRSWLFGAFRQLLREQP